MGSGRGQCSGPTGLEKALGAVGSGAQAQGTEEAQAFPAPLVSEVRGPHLGAQQASWARVGGADALLSSPAPPVWEGPSRLPLLISLASGAPILSGLRFSSPLSPATSYQLTLGFLCLLGGQSPPPAAGRCPRCGETLTLHLPTPLS